MLLYLYCLLLSRTIHWNYCVLDEGHIIKNTKTQVRHLLLVFNLLGMCLFVLVYMVCSESIWSVVSLYGL